MLVVGHALGHVTFVRRHIEVLALFVVLLSVLPIVFEMTRRGVRSRASGQ